MRRKRQQKTFPNPWTVGACLDCVEQWAVGYMMLRETGALLSEGPWKTVGRMDAILVPVTWNVASYKALKFEQGIVGIEVKRFRQDFRKGLKAGQYERYAAVLSGLYLCTPYGVCKTSEIPKPYGHLIVAERGTWEDEYKTCLCRRQPQWQPMQLDQVMFWRLLWRFMQWLADQRKAEKESMERTRRRILDRFQGLLGRIEREIKQPPE